MAQREILAKKFQQLEFKDLKTGKTLAYNLFTPQNLDPNKKYPLVLFMADASTAGKGIKAPLMQGWGGIIWATDENQAKNPAFVLVPAFSEKAVYDDWTTRPEVAMTLDLVKKTLTDYPIDANRVYTTGQSMGGMISFYFNSIEPDLFAASYFVGSKWDINVLKPLEKNKWIFTLADGDLGAVKTYRELTQMLNADQVAFEQINLSAKLPQNEQNAQVSALLAKGSPINIVYFDKGTVLPANNTESKGGEHMYSFDYAYKLAPAREWLLMQSKAAKDVMTADKLQAGQLLNQAIAFYDKKDFQAALNTFYQADKAGHIKAKRYIGLMYLNGQGVAKDERRAFDNFKQASKNGDITSQYWLGYCYENGIGTKSDLNQAIAWYKKSAQRGDHVSQPAMDALKRLNVSF
ncbi:Putative beta-lactamase hcpD precursor [Moraxella cuniculi]|uniref:Beta-lactamase hcpD n=1 Tax=Moraxella cuniculi TaxID=34061 RepID=A0A3S4SD29_9GAMM|nr:Putative beta-lactamase hcpD precursor [Moraxella cuniculi]